MINAFPSLYILADDVTGAADCAARCKGVGLPATILLEPAVHALPLGAVALSSDSRYLPPPQAAERVRALCLALQQTMPQTETTLWYKKIDSTLRGNIGAELATMMTMRSGLTTRPCAILAPAFPAQGRGLVDGYLVYAQATQRLHLPSLLAEQTTLPLATLELPLIRAGVEPVAARLLTDYAAGAQLFVADALTEADLQTIYHATQRALPQSLFCGSAGLIGVIAAALVEAQGETKATSLRPPPQLAHPILAVVGSGSVMAQRQLSRLRQLSALDLYEVDPHQANGVRATLGDGNNARCALHLPPPGPAARLEGETARQYAATLGTAALAQLRQRRPQTLLLVGGDTAFHLLHLLGIRSLQVEAELLPGMPLTTGSAADGQRYQIILKAGNHGDEETLVQLFAEDAP